MKEKFDDLQIKSDDEISENDFDRLRKISELIENDMLRYQRRLDAEEEWM